MYSEFVDAAKFSSSVLREEDKELEKVLPVSEAFQQIKLPHLQLAPQADSEMLSAAQQIEDDHVASAWEASNEIHTSTIVAVATLLCRT